MTHAHNIDSAISTAVALQGARFSTAALMRPQASIASTSILSQVVPKFITRLPSVPKLQKESPMLDIACGSVAGITSKFIEHPFDTIKVRLQSQSINAPVYTSTMDCVRKSLASASLYQGIASPLVGAVAENSILFLSYSFALSKFAGEKPSLAAQTAAGAFSGACVSFLLTPVELVKCRVQIHGGSTLSVLRQTVMREGFQGLYCGYSGTFLRETVGGAAWFGVYEYTNGRLQNPLLAGACAGIAFNAALFPADVIKSIQQTQTTNSGFLSIGRKLWASQGVAGLYRGFGITAARAGPSSAMIFWTYEGIKTWLSQK